MNRLADIDRVGAHLDGKGHLADHVAGVRADDAAAQNFPVAVRIGAVIEQQLGEAFVAAVGNRAARRGPREQTLLDLDALRLGLVFGQADLRARFSSWSRFGVWEKIPGSVSSKADLENVCIDSTVVRAHACAAGAAASNAAAEALGRSRGGFSCKIHALTDALGLPVRFILTGGQAADITQAIPLMQD